MSINCSIARMLTYTWEDHRDLVAKHLKLGERDRLDELKDECHDVRYICIHTRREE